MIHISRLGDSTHIDYSHSVSSEKTSCSLPFIPQSSRSSIRNVQRIGRGSIEFLTEDGGEIHTMKLDGDEISLVGKTLIVDEDSISYFLSNLLDEVDRRRQNESSDEDDASLSEESTDEEDIHEVHITIPKKDQYVSGGEEYFKIRIGRVAYRDILKHFNRNSKSMLYILAKYAGFSNAVAKRDELVRYLHSHVRFE